VCMWEGGEFNVASTLMALCALTDIKLEKLL
jgi:hypothetical protein